MRSSSNYKTRMLVVLAAVLVASFLLLSVVNYVTIRASVRRETVMSDLPLTRENIYSDILSDLMPPINVSASMASDAFLINWAREGELDTDPIIEYLREIKNEFDYFSAFFVSAGTGAYYHADGLLKLISPSDDHDVWFYRFIKSNKPYDLDVDTNEAADNRLTIFVNYRVEDFDGRLIGVAGVGIEMQSFSRFLEGRGQEYGRQIYLADPDGIIQAHADPTLVERTSMYDREGLSEIASELLEKRDEPIDSSYSSHGHRTLITSRYMPEFGWFIIVEQDEASLLTVPRKNLVRTIVVGLFTSLVIIVISLFTINSFQDRLRRQAATDELTGLPNRRELQAAFARFLSRYERNGTRFSIIIFDIDYFKEINDRSGHLAGDRVIQALTRTMTLTLRPTDVLSRWGGDEFLLISECSLEEAVTLAERVRSRVEAEELDAQYHLFRKVSLSCGVTEFTEGDTMETAVSRADQALYESKDRGRNTVSAISGQRDNR